MHRLRRGVLALALVCRVVSSVVIALMMCTIVYDVLARYAFGRPTTWVLEANAIALVALTFLALPDLYARNQHIAMDLAHNRMSDAWRRVSSVVVRLAAVVFALLLVVLGINSTREVFGAGMLTSGIVLIPVWIIYALIPLSAAVLLLIAVLPPRSRSEEHRGGPDAGGSGRSEKSEEVSAG
ncbi:MAG: TRAP transporter small permease subunit [Streptosporangiales bacterium]|nr:TRAP transporter small permease subunit [Streptosporangiales bacterium]